SSPAVPFTTRTPPGLITASGTVTLNVPIARAGEKFPFVSATWFGRTETVYEPFSAESKNPPGAVNRYVACRVGATCSLSSETSCTTCDNPPGPVTTTSPVPIVGVFTAALSDHVTQNVGCAAPPPATLP